MINTFFCKKKCSKHGHLCTKKAGHSGPCSYRSLTRTIEKIEPKLGRKMGTDSYMTPGNKGAAKNRADRCFPIQYSKQEIYEANKRGEYGTCIPTRFSSTPEDCFQINVELAIQIISIENFYIDEDLLDEEERDVLGFLSQVSKYRYPNNLRCRICNELIFVENFHTAHGSSADKQVQLGHIIPYINGEDETAHVAGNTQWIHRDCNIIQGEKTEQETFQQLSRILINQGYKVFKPEVKSA